MQSTCVLAVFEIRCNLCRPSGPIGCKSCRPEGELAGPKFTHVLTYFYVVIQLYILGGSGGLPPVKKKKCKLNQWKPLFPAQKLPARPGRLPEKLPARRQTCRFCADGPAVISNTARLSFVNYFQRQKVINFICNVFYVFCLLALVLGLC